MATPNGSPQQQPPGGVVLVASPPSTGQGTGPVRRLVPAGSTTIELQDWPGSKSNSSDNKLSGAAKAAKIQVSTALHSVNLFTQPLLVTDPAVVAAGVLKTRVFLTLMTVVTTVLIVGNALTPTTKLLQLANPTYDEYQAALEYEPSCACSHSVRIGQVSQLSLPQRSNFSSNACAAIAGLYWACANSPVQRVGAASTRAARRWNSHDEWLSHLRHSGGKLPGVVPGQAAADPAALSQFQSTCTATNEGALLTATIVTPALYICSLLQVALATTVSNIADTTLPPTLLDPTEYAAAVEHAAVSQLQLLSVSGTSVQSPLQLLSQIPTPATIEYTAGSSSRTPANCTCVGWYPPGGFMPQDVAAGTAFCRFRIAFDTRNTSAADAYWSCFGVINMLGFPLELLSNSTYAQLGLPQQLYPSYILWPNETVLQVRF